MIHDVVIPSTRATLLLLFMQIHKRMQAAVRVSCTDDFFSIGVSHAQKHTNTHTLIPTQTHMHTHSHAYTHKHTVTRTTNTLTSACTTHTL